MSVLYFNKRTYTYGRKKCKHDLQTTIPTLIDISNIRLSEWKGLAHDSLIEIISDNRSIVSNIICLFIDV